MRRWDLLVAIAVVAGTGLFAWYRSTVSESPRPPAFVVLSSRLPVLGLVGDLPPAESRLVIELPAAGPPTFEGRELSEENFHDLLVARADASREADRPNASKLDVVIRVDRDAPWWRAAQVLEACADPRVRVYRTWFAALPEAGAAEGAMAAFLPGIGCLCHGQHDPRGDPVGVRIRIPPEDPKEPTIDSRRLVPALVGAWENVGETPDRIQAALEAAPSMPTEAVLRVFDACLRSGAGSVVFRRIRGDAERANVAVHPVGSGVPWSISGGEARHAPISAPPRAIGRVAGQLTSPSSPIEETRAIDEAGDEPAEMRSSFGHSGQQFPAIPSRRYRAPALRAEGGEGTEAAVEGALDWLRRHQGANGSWDAEGFDSMCKIEKCGGAGMRKYTPGVTGLALLAFLGRGETHKTPRYGPVIRNGLKYLKGLQNSEGSFAPRIASDVFIPGHEVSNPDSPGVPVVVFDRDPFTYNHAIAATAMADAYGMTQSPLFKASAQNGLNFVLRCQNPYLGWRYGVRPMDNDTSVTAWMVLALETGKRAGLDVDPAAYEGAMAWLDKVTDPETGRTGYTARDNGPARVLALLDRFPPNRSEATTAMGVLTRILCGTAIDDPFVTKGADLCLATPPLREESGDSIDHCYWFFGSEALFRIGGDRWTRWNESMKKAVLAGRRADAAEDRAGSWDPDDPWGKAGGRVYATAMNALCLEVYYRHPRRSAK